MEGYTVFVDGKSKYKKCQFLLNWSLNCVIIDKIPDWTQFQIKPQKNFSFVEIYKLILEFIEKWKGLKGVKAILKKNEAGEFTQLYIRTVES